MTLDIFMPYWGDSELAITAVRSVLGQDDDRWRLTVLDDRYPDQKFADYVLGLAARDSRVSYLLNSENLGPSKNYNQAVRLATQEYVTILGCDDVLLTNYVSRIHQLSETYAQPELIQPGVEVIDERGVRYRPLADRVKSLIRPTFSDAQLISGEPLADSLMKGNWTYFPSIAWKTSVMKAASFREDLNVVQDLEMIMTIVLDGGKLVYDPTVSFEYRRHRQSYSSQTGVDGSKFLQELKLFGELEGKLKAAGWTKAARRSKLHLMSRISAATVIPSAIATRHHNGIQRLLRFVFVP